jgi:hypothetical protein
VGDVDRASLSLLRARYSIAAKRKGGIGSWLVEHINRSYENFQIDTDVEVHIADPDTIEIKNVKYQNFNKKEVLCNKARALLSRYEYIAKAFEVKVAELKGNYDLYILAVDNFDTRANVISYCHKNNKDFIDLRAEGRNVFAMYKGESFKEDMATLNQADATSGSCQKPDEFKRNIIQYGNQIAASIGIQMFLNYLRGNIGQKRFLLRI